MSIPDRTSSVAPGVPVSIDARDAFFQRDHLLTDLRGHSARAGLATAIGQVLRLGIRISTIPVLNRLLTPDDVGVFTIVAGFTVLAAMFSLSGLTTVTVQRQRLTHAEASSLFWLNIGLGAALALLVLLASPVLAAFYNDPRLGPVCMVMSVTILLSSGSLQHQAILTRQMRARTLSAIDVSTQAAGIAAAIALAWTGAGYWALVVQPLVSQALLGISLVLACRWVPSRPRLVRGIGQMASSGMMLTWCNVVGTFRAQVDLGAVAKVFGTEAAGAYSRSYSVLQLPVMQFVQPMAQVAIPMLSLLVTDTPRLRAAWRQLQEKLALVVVPPLVGLIATSDLSVRILLGPQWNESARIFAVLGVLGVVQPVFIAHHWMYIACDRSRAMLTANLASLALVVVGSLGPIALAGWWPWLRDPMAVAVGVTMMWTVVGVPWQFWHTSRSTPLTIHDLTSSLAPAFVYGAVVLVACLVLRRLVSFSAQSLSGAVIGLSACVAVSLLACALFYAVVPAFRSPVSSAIELAAGPVLRRLRRSSPNTGDAE